MPIAPTPPPPPIEDRGLWDFLPEALKTLENPQKDIPRIAKDVSLTAEIEHVLGQIPTTHHLYRKDAREIELPHESVQLVLTSPPYWTLKEYRQSPGQLGDIAKYERFLGELDKVWKRCFDGLVPVACSCRRAKAA